MIIVGYGLPLATIRWQAPFLTTPFEFPRVMSGFTFPTSRGSKLSCFFNVLRVYESLHSIYVMILITMTAHCQGKPKARRLRDLQG